MKSFLTNIDNDIYLDSYGNFTTAEGIDAEAQVLRNILRLQQYEYSYDLSRGIDYLGNVLTDAPNLIAWETQVLNTVKHLDFVNQITRWVYDVNNHNLEFRLSVKTDAGEIEIRG